MTKPVFAPLQDFVALVRGQARSSYSGVVAPQLTVRLEPWVYGMFEELQSRSRASRNRLINQALEAAFNAVLESMSEDEARQLREAAGRRAAELPARRGDVGELQFDGEGK